jgi:hypothetical protein
MRRRGQQTSLQERLTIQTLSQAGQTDAQIAASLGCSPSTVRKWRRIAQRAERSSLVSSFGRPAQGALSSFSHPLRDAIRALRSAHPGWGADTIRAELAHDPLWADTHLPSRARIAAFLKEEGLTRPYQRRRPPPQPPPVCQAAHDQWQLDAQGATTVDGLGKVSVINLIDVLSRLKLESYPALDTTQPTTADYQLVLRRAFTTVGLPRQLSLDHGCAFYDNTCRSPFPTRLHLWLLALGVEVLFTRVRCPTDHALVERLHQTMTAQALVGQSYADQAGLWAALDVRRERLNNEIGCAGLGGLAPLEANPSARASGRAYRVEWEAEMLCLERVDQYLAQGEWFRNSNSHGEVYLGGQRYNLGTRWCNSEVELHYQAESRSVIGQPAGSTQTYRWPVRGLQIADLMGELAPVLTLPQYQLTLPFSRETWRQLELARMVA